MIIECSHCESKVDGVVKGEVEGHDDEYPFPFKTVLVECPICRNALLGMTEHIQTGPDNFEWDNLHRVYPEHESNLDWGIPEIARNSLIEAKICYKAKAFSASAVMCGRTIEGVCNHHSTKSKTLAGGLKELKQKGIIDERLFEWGDELRKHRNIGAHATSEKISKEDAKDLLDFSSAICEYVFILNEKFNRFKERNKKA
ncbi:DUF4145 domain-containing protein [Pseudomonadota bacterium]